MRGVVTIAMREDGANRLQKLARISFYAVIVMTVCCVLFVGIRIVTAFTSGRVNQILHQAAQSTSEGGR
jgi:hypothetical protein